MFPCFVFGHVFLAECFVAVFAFCVERGLCSAFGALDHLHQQLPGLGGGPVPFKRVLGLVVLGRCPIPVLVA